MRPKFDEQLAALKNGLIEMGSLCEEAIFLVGRALSEGSCGLAEQVLSQQEHMDQMERDIENLCLKLILQQQPVAGDLRQISAALKIVTDMERIGVQASDIAEIIELMITDGYKPEDVGHIRQMATEASKMVSQSVDSYVEQDEARARRVIAYDDVVDGYFTQVRSVLIERVVQDPAAGEHLLDLLMIDKYLERIADHAVNIAEWVIFSITGIKEGDHEDIRERTDKRS